MRAPLDSSPDNPEAAAIDLPGGNTRHAQATRDRDLVCRDFRDALGSFATGVTVLTTLATDGKPIGLTISSFNAVSLDPPLILWSLACDSPRLAAFRHAGHYAVNVLAANQEAISNCFASRDEDRFDALVFTPGLAGVRLGWPEYPLSKAARRGLNAVTRRIIRAATTLFSWVASSALPVARPPIH